MTRYVTDTHALVWHLQASPKLSQTGQAIFNDADRGVNEITVPSIVLVELVFLAERKRIDRALVARAFNALEPSSINYRIAPLDLPIVRTMQDIGPDKIPEMPDRIIAATAKHLGISLITRDKAISYSRLVNTVW